MCYRDLSYEPDPERNLLAKYLLPPSEADARLDVAPWPSKKADALRHVTEIFTAKVFRVDEEGGFIDVAYPVELFEPDNVAQWLSILTGALFGPGTPDGIMLLDISMPEVMRATFDGPKFGLEGVRRIVGTDITGRPHLGMAFGRLGMTAEEMSAAAYEVGRGGACLLRDNVALTDQRFCRMPNRIVNVMEALDRVREEGGQRVLYAVNVTADAAEVLDRADTAIENGANCLMVDVLSAGLPSLSELSGDASVAVPIHAHVASRAHRVQERVHATPTSALTKLIRMLGGDQIEMAIGSMLRSDVLAESRQCKGAMLEEWRGIRRAFPVVIGAVDPREAHFSVGELGRDIVVLADDEAVHGHPKGGGAGAMALNQAIDAALAGVSVEDYAERHEELRMALWGKGAGARA